MKKKRKAKKQVAACMWFAGCRNAATGHTPHPVLGDVPTCDRCHKFATGSERVKKNPRRMERWAIYAKSGAVRTHFTGKKFEKGGKAVKFSSQTDAYSKALDLVNRYPALKQTRLTVEKLSSPKIEARRNPSGYRRAVDAFARELDEADERLNAFAGRSARETLSIHEPPIRAGLVIGKLEGVMYRANRGDGDHNYFHRFKKNSRPLLISKHDGSQIGIVGGQYQFTERGIEDL